MTDLPTLLVTASRITGESRVALRTLTAALREDDFDGARAVLERYLEDVGSLLGEPAPASATPTRMPAEGSGDPERALLRWLRSFAKLFTEWRLEDAQRLAELPPPVIPSRLARAPALVLSGTRAVRSGRHDDARDMLDLLLRARDVSQRPRHLIGGSKRALLLVHLGRVALFVNGDTEYASECFAAAVRLAPDEAVVHAALGSLHQAHGDAAEALSAYQHAITEAPTLPDGYVGMGRLASDAERHDEAANWFGRALDVLEGADVDQVGRLFAPVPAALTFECGRRLAATDPDAALSLYRRGLDALDASELQIRARIHVASGDLLAETQPAAAAEAYYEAARPGWMADDQRLQLLQRVTELDPRHAHAQWELAELLRLQSLGPGDRQELATWIQRAADAWARGYAASDSPAHLAWTFISRALIAERTAELAEEDQLAELWSAVRWSEHALLQDADAYAWLHASRMFRILELEANALDASERAIALAPHDPYVLTERAWALLAAGRSNEAIDVVEPALAAEPDLWLRLAAGWALAEDERYDDGLAVMQEALERHNDNWDDESAKVSLLALGGRCLHGLRRWDDELELREQIIALTEEDVAPRRERAWALYVVGRERGDRRRLDEAVAVFRALEQDDFERGRWLYFDGGVAQLAAGERQGEEWIRRGIAMCRVPADLVELTRDIDDLRQRAPESARLQLDELRAAAAARQTSARLLSAAEELREREPDIRARPAVAMSLARIRRQERDWPGAFAAAETLYEVLDQSTCRTLASGTVRQALEEIRGLLARDEASAASEVLTLAAAHTAHVDAPHLEAEVLSLLVLARLRLGDREGARAALASALNRLAQSDVMDPLDAWWSRCGPLARDADEVWELEEVASQSRDGETGRPLHLARHLAALEDELDVGEPVHDPRPVVELGEALIPADTGPKWSLFSTLIPAMDDRVQAETGVRFPGARFRTGLDLTPREYAIFIAGLQARRELIPYATIELADEDEPIAQVVDGLEVVVRRNLAEFTTLDDLLDLLPDGDTSGGAHLLLDRPTKLRLSAIMRALAADGVALTAVEVIAAHSIAYADASDAVANVRLALWRELPGNRADRRRLPLPDDVLAAIDDAFEMQSGTLALTASPLEADGIERMLSEWVAATGQDTVTVVVETEQQRRVVQRLIRRRHPDVPVLSRAETTEALSSDAHAAEGMHG